jgi:hypothetical protein
LSRRSRVGSVAPGAAGLGLERRGWMARCVADVEERFLVPCFASPRRNAWIHGYGLLALPLQAVGRERFGIVRCEGHPVRVTGIGRPRRIREFLRNWFDDPLPSLESGARCCLWRPSDCVRRPAELRVVEIHGWAARRFRRAGWHIVPDSVRWTGALDSIPPADLDRSLRSDLNKIRRGGFSIEETNAGADWEEFFHSLVRPAALHRFGDAAWIPSERTMRAFSRAGTLLMLSSAGRRVAGICVIPAGNTLWAPVLGTAVGADARTGIGAALYKLTADWAREHGFERLDFGRTSSCVADPVAWYKRKWGFRPAPDPLAHRLAIWIDSRADQLKRAIAREPVLVEGPSGLSEFPGSV